MFVKGNLVRLKDIVTEDATIMQVNKDSGDKYTYVEVNGIYDSYVTDQLELVSDETFMNDTEAKPMELQTPKIDEDYLIEQINKYMTSLVVNMRNQDITDKITLTIKCENYTSDDSTIEYKAMIGYDMSVESRVMSSSCNILVARVQQNKELEVKAIPHYK